MYRQIFARYLTDVPSFEDIWVCGFCRLSTILVLSSSCVVSYQSQLVQWCIDSCTVAPDIQECRLKSLKGLNNGDDADLHLVDVFGLDEAAVSGVLNLG